MLNDDKYTLAMTHVFLQHQPKDCSWTPARRKKKKRPKALTRRTRVKFWTEKTFWLNKKPRTSTDQACVKFWTGETFWILKLTKFKLRPNFSKQGRESGRD